LYFALHSVGIIMSDEDGDLQIALIKADELITALLQELESKDEIIESKNEVIATLEAKLVDQSVELASVKTEIDKLAEVSDFDSSLRLSSNSAVSDLRLDVSFTSRLLESSDRSVDRNLDLEGLEGSNESELQPNKTLSLKRPSLFRWSIGSSTRSIDNYDDCPDKSSRSYAADDDMSHSSDFDESNRSAASSSGFLGIRRFMQKTQQDVIMPPSSQEKTKAPTRTKNETSRRRPSRRPKTEQSKKSSRSFIAGVCFPETEEDAERHWATA